MPWNGSGTFNRTDGTRTGATVWTQAKAASVKVVAAGHDTHDEDIVTGLENCLARDGQNQPSADINWGGYKITNLAEGTTRAGAATVSQIQDALPNWGGTAGGSVNALTLTLAPAPTAYTAGMVIRFITSGANTDPAVTINVNGLGVKTISNSEGNDIGVGNFANNELIEAVYDGTKFRGSNK